MFNNRFYFLEGLKEKITPKHMVIAIIVVVMTILLGVCSLFFNKEEEDKGIIEIRVRDVNYLNETVTELINKGDKYSVIYINGEEATSSKPIQSKGKAMELPRVTGTVDIEKNEKLKELTYKASLEESAKYINYLKKQGYEILREAYTSEYIEFYMTKGTITRRIIILNNIIMTGELEDSWKLPDIEEYFK